MIDKKGLSEVVGYVLLIGVAISLSVLVYSFINSYIPKPASECPAEVSIILKDYECNQTSDTINITLQNKGLFDIDGFILKAANDDSAPTKNLDYTDIEGEASIVYFDSLTDLTLHPSEDYSRVFSYSQHQNVTRLQIIPFKLYKGESLLCGQSQVTQIIEGCN